MKFDYVSKVYVCESCYVLIAGFFLEASQTTLKLAVGVTKISAKSLLRYL